MSLKLWLAGPLLGIFFAFQVMAEPVQIKKPMVGVALPNPPDLGIISVKMDNHTTLVSFSVINMGKGASAVGGFVFVRGSWSKTGSSFSIPPISPGQARAFSVPLPRPITDLEPGMSVMLDVKYPGAELSKTNNHYSLELANSMKPAPFKNAVVIKNISQNKSVPLKAQNSSTVSARPQAISAGPVLKSIPSKAISIKPNVAPKSLDSTNNAMVRVVEEKKIDVKPLAQVQSPQPKRPVLISHQFYLGGASLFILTNGDFQIITSQEIDPHASNQALTFSWDVSKLENAKGVIWQVSRVPYLEFMGGNTSDLNPQGLAAFQIASGQTGSFSVDFKSLMKMPVFVNQKLTLADKSSPFTKNISTTQDHAGSSWTKFLELGGTISYYVRVIPLASLNSEEAVGAPSNVMRVYYGKMPPADSPEISIPVQNQQPLNIHLVRFQYFPYHYYCYVHANPEDCGQFKGGTTYPYEVVLEALADAWNWLSEAYSDAKGAVVSVVSSALPFVPEGVISAALDTALAAAGIPPNIPNLDQLMEGGADYLAAQMIEQGGIPAGAGLTQEKLKEAMIAGAQAAKGQISSAGPETACKYKLDPAYIVVTVENDSDQDYASVQVYLDPNFQIFNTKGVTLGGPLKRGMKTPVPLLLGMSQAEEFWNGQLYDEQAWWNAYHQRKTRFTVYVNAANHSSPLKLYESPPRAWDEAFEN